MGETGFQVGDVGLGDFEGVDEGEGLADAPEDGVLAFEGVLTEEAFESG